MSLTYKNGQLEKVRFTDQPERVRKPRWYTVGSRVLFVRDLSVNMPIAVSVG